MPWRVERGSPFLIRPTPFHRTLQQRVYSPTPSNTFCWTLMDCFNNDSDFHPRTALAAEEPEIYSFLNRMSALAIEEARNCAYDVPVNRLGVAESGSAFNCQTSFGATPSYGEHHSHPFINRHLTCGFQSRSSWPPHTRTESTIVSGPYPPVSAGRNTKLGRSSQGP